MQVMKAVRGTAVAGAVAVAALAPLVGPVAPVLVPSLVLAEGPSSGVAQEADAAFYGVVYNQSAHFVNVQFENGVSRSLPPGEFSGSFSDVRKFTTLTGCETYRLDGAGTWRTLTKGASVLLSNRMAEVRSRC